MESFILAVEFDALTQNLVVGRVRDRRLPNSRDETSLRPINIKHLQFASISACLLRLVTGCSIWDVEKLRGRMTAYYCNTGMIQRTSATRRTACRIDPVGHEGAVACNGSYHFSSTAKWVLWSTHAAMERAEHPSHGQGHSSFFRIRTKHATQGHWPFFWILLGQSDSNSTSNEARNHPAIMSKQPNTVPTLHAGHGHPQQL